MCRSAAISGYQGKPWLISCGKQEAFQISAIKNWINSNFIKNTYAACPCDKDHLLSKQLVKKDGGERGRDTGEESCRKPPNFPSYKYIHYLMDKRLEKAFSFLPTFLRSLFQQETWTGTENSSPSVLSFQFAPVSHSRLVCFLTASPCFAIASALSPKLPAAAQVSEAAPVPEADLTAETPARRSSVERHRSQQRSRCVLSFPSQSRHRRKGLVRAGESSGTEQRQSAGRSWADDLPKISSCTWGMCPAPEGMPLAAKITSLFSPFLPIAPMQMLLFQPHWGQEPADRVPEQYSSSANENRCTVIDFLLDHSVNLHNIYSCEKEAYLIQILDHQRPHRNVLQHNWNWMFLESYGVISISYYILQGGLSYYTALVQLQN